MTLLNVATRNHGLLWLKNIQLSSKNPSRYIQSNVVHNAPERDLTLPAGIPGSGAGKGGGGGGTVRESGGGLGKYGAAQEESYFHQKQREQLEKLKKRLKAGEDIGFVQKPKS